GSNNLPDSLMRCRGTVVAHGAVSTNVNYAVSPSAHQVDVRQRDHFAKKRWVKVAMNVISIRRPMMASAAASTVSWLARSTFSLGEKPRPWNDVMLNTTAASGLRGIPAAGPST